MRRLVVRLRRRLPLLLAVLLALPLAPLVGAETFDDDCGAGSDAGGNATASRRVGFDVACAAAFSDRQDVDAYHVETPWGVRARFAFDAPAMMEACLLDPWAHRTHCATGFRTVEILTSGIEGRWTVVARPVNSSAGDGSGAYSLLVTRSTEFDEASNDCATGLDMDPASNSGLYIRFANVVCVGRLATVEDVDVFPLLGPERVPYHVVVSTHQIAELEACVVMPFAWREPQEHCARVSAGSPAILIGGGDNGDIRDVRVRMVEAGVADSADYQLHAYHLGTDRRSGGVVLVGHPGATTISVDDAARALWGGDGIDSRTHALARPGNGVDILVVTPYDDADFDMMFLDADGRAMRSSGCATAGSARETCVVPMGAHAVRYAATYGVLPGFTARHVMYEDVPQPPR